MSKVKDRYRRRSQEQLISLLIPDGPPSAMYDLGVGPYAEFQTLKEIWPDMQVFACEPDPYEFLQALPLVEAIGGKLVRVAIVGRDKSGLDVDFHTCDPGQGGGSLHDLGSNGRGIIRTLGWSLDDFDIWAISQSNIIHDRILLWADIEGSELEMLRGGQELLRSGRVHWINLETRDHDDRPNRPTTLDITKFLHDFGYDPVHRYGVQGDYPEAPGDTIYFRRGVVPLLPPSSGAPFEVIT